jgi:hypothetical protein
MCFNGSGPRSDNRGYGLRSRAIKWALGQLQEPAGAGGGVANGVAGRRLHTGCRRRARSRPDASNRRAARQSTTNNQQSTINNQQSTTNKESMNRKSRPLIAQIKR